MTREAGLYNQVYDSFIEKRRVASSASAFRHGGQEMDNSHSPGDRSSPDNGESENLNFLQNRVGYHADMVSGIA